jgi:outer membrane lipoprotein SlyB
METQATAATSTPIHPLAWVAGIAVIVFSAVGIGALMGWIPNSIGGSGSRPLAEAQPPAIVAPAAPAASVKRAAPAAQPAPVAQSAPIVRPAPVPAAPVMASARCAECGVIESVREIETKGEGTGLGAVGGAVAGGLLGSQIGGGHGKEAMAVVGAVGGGFAGNEVEKRIKSTKSYSITVRLDDGTSRVISSATAPAWRTGDKVRIVNGAIQSNA